MRFTMWITIAITSTLLLGSVPAETVAGSPQSLLERGLASYRAGRLEESVTGLNAAADALLAPGQLQAYVTSGEFQNLDQLETALVYLTLANSRLGREADAREAVLRLMSAERIAPTYAGLALTAEAAEFERIAAGLVPSAQMPRNIQLAGGAPPPVTAPAPAPSTAVASTQPPAAQSATAQPAPAAAIADRQIERQRIVDELVSMEGEEIRREAEARIAAERAAAQREAEERIASERSAIQRAADERIATERAAIERAADKRVAAEHEVALREAEDRILAVEMGLRRSYLIRLREAETFIGGGRADRANEIYTRLGNAENVPREVIAEAATGLYRTGAYRDAVRAFQKMGTFSRGEEDLRYYNAVALYETGEYSAARRELSCALPYIEPTDEVSRYRGKIERTSAQQ